MVQVDISQLSGECNTWRESLRHFRDEISQDKVRLQQAASRPLSKQQLQDVEHLHNQFHIQLINIHDLKQAIKTHDRILNFEIAAHADPSDAAAWIGMLESQLMLHQSRDVEQTARRLGTLLDDRDPRLFQVASLLAHHGDSAAAIPMMERARRAFPQSAPR